MGVYCSYRGHVAQQAIHAARNVRFRTVCTGRRFGKTICMAGELFDRGGGERGGDYGWVAPTYNVAERGVDAFRLIAPDFARVMGRAPCRIEYQGWNKLEPTRIWFLSADNPDAILGYGFQGLVIDEAASVPEEVWNYVLRPTLSQTLGWAVFVSTPKGRNWFYDMYQRGLDPAEKDYASFRFPSYMSPYFPMKEWEEAKRSLPEDVFRQEYMAEFLEDSAGVFRGIDGCLIPEDLTTKDTKGTKEGGGVVIGCDVAKHTDWTVLIAMDVASGRCLEMERFNLLDWPIQKERIAGFCRKWRGRLILDATGVGDPIFDDLKRVVPDIEGFKFTAQSKVEIVQRLSVAVEQRKVRWPSARIQNPEFRSQNEREILGQKRGGEEFNAEAQRRRGEERATLSSGPWEVLTNEMKRYEYQIGPSGQISYGAPSGHHDDCVMALALANHGKWQAENCCGQIFRIQSRWMEGVRRRKAERGAW